MNEGLFEWTNQKGPIRPLFTSSGKCEKIYLTLDENFAAYMTPVSR